MLVDRALKAASVSDLLGSDTVRGALLGEKPQDQDDSPEIDEKAVLSKVRRRLAGRRTVTVEAGDAGAAAYIRANKAKIRSLMRRLNAQGVI